jgi:flagellar hook-basal body complex protein FliE
VIEKIESMDRVHHSIASVTKLTAGSTAPVKKFQDLFGTWLKAASEAEKKAQALAHQFSSGSEEVSIHQAMIAAQKSFIMIKASTEMTKRCLNAYHAIWNMPV